MLFSLTFDFRNQATLKKPVVRTPAKSVPEPTALSSSEDEDSDLEGDDMDLAQISSSEDEDEVDMDGEDAESAESAESDHDTDEGEDEDEHFIGSDEEQDYELKPRKIAQEWTKKDKFTKLPIKLPGGKWEQAAEVEYSDEGSGNEDEIIPENDSDVSEIEMEEADIPEIKPKKQSFLAKKEELAQIASTIMEDPETNVRV